jgi:hypothetical protein
MKQFLGALLAASLIGAASAACAAVRVAPGGDSPAVTAPTPTLPAPLLTAIAAGPVLPTPRPGMTHPYVILAWDDSGDFGPGTPGTRTSGWQEALDACADHQRDLYVKGGYGGLSPIYHVQDTIRFPPAQDFKVDGGVYVVNWTGPADRDLMVIDSCMNCEIHLGILVYGGFEAALRVRPERPVPIDGFPVVVETWIVSQGMADPHPFTPGERAGGSGLVFDGSRAPIVHSSFKFFGVLNFKTVIETAGAFSQNDLEVLHLHTNADRGTLLVVGPRSAGNTFRLAIGVDQGAGGVTGLDIRGRNNAFEVMPRPSNQPFPPGRMIVFREAAAGNQVNLLAQDMASPLAGIADQAAVPTNQVTWAGAPAPIAEIAGQAGTFTYTQRLYPASVRVSGAVTGVQLVRGAQSVDVIGLAQTGILLSVADQLVVAAAQAPMLQVVPIKVK